MKIFAWIIIVALVLVGGFYALNNFIYDQKQAEPNNFTMSDDVKIIPIEHASFIMEWRGSTIYTDPVGDVSMYAGQSAPDLILLTDIHGDHLDIEILQALVNENTTLLAPQAVADQLPSDLKARTTIMANGEAINYAKFNIDAVPMYNFPESEDAYHTKGRGNGYVLQSDGKRVYVAGDTGPTPELMNMQNIDIAFVPMNLPYTMSVEDAADAVLAFKPKQVIPYHYRTPDGHSDVNKFKTLVNAGDSGIDVLLLDWY